MMNLLKLFLSTFALLTVLQQQRAAASTHATLSPRCPSPSRATGIQRAAQGPPWDSLDYRSLDELPRPEPAEYERLLSLTASEAAAELCSRNVTAVAYARALLLRIRETECLNAWSAFDAARVLSDAAAIDSLAQAGKDVRPLCGLPVALKDMIDADGYPTTAGTPALEGHFPPFESLLVTRLKQAHGVVLGKLRMHELGGGDTSLNPLYGPVLNPHNVTHIAGGSSAGSGAAVAARAAPAALCADSGGSCRSPAAATGTVGFRPSTGCFNAGAGALQLTHLRDSVGVIARSVADAQLLNSVLTDCLPDPLFPPLPNVHAAPLTGLGVHGADIHGPGSAAAAERRRRRLSEGGGAAAGAGGAGEAVNLRGLRIGVAGDLMRDVGEEMKAPLDAAVAALERAGAVLVRADAGFSRVFEFYSQALPDDLFYAAEAPGLLAAYLAAHNYSASLQEVLRGVATPGTRRWLESFVHRHVRGAGLPGREVAGARPTPAEYFRAVSEAVPELRKVWEAVFSEARVDLLALPAAPLPARPIPETEPLVEFRGRRRPFYEVQGRFFLADSVAGIPSVTIPTGATTAGAGGGAGGLPGALMLHAPRGRDSFLLAAAAAVEAALPPGPRVLPGPPACAGCSPRLGFVPVSFPAELVGGAAEGRGGSSSSDSSSSSAAAVGARAPVGSAAYADEAFALDFEGDCEVKRAPGAAFPLLPAFAVPGAAVRWGGSDLFRAQLAEQAPAAHPAGEPASCAHAASEGEEADPSFTPASEEAGDGDGEAQAEAEDSRPPPSPKEHHSSSSSEGSSSSGSSSSSTSDERGSRRTIKQMAAAEL